MMIRDVSNVPTEINCNNSNSRIHESCLRSYQIVLKVKEWLVQEVPHAVILELIEEMDTAFGREYIAKQ